MIRLLTAVLLFASFDAVADTEVPHTFEDGTPASAAEVNANFDALETAIDAIPEGPAGPAGAKGDTGDTGPQGEKGDTGDQGIQGEQGPQGLAGNNGVQGDKGDTGDQGPAGADGRDAVGGFSHSWTFNTGNQGYGQFSTGAFVARADSDYTSNKYGVTELWINLEDSESNTIGTGPSTAGGADATDFFSFFGAGDLVSLKNIEDSGDSVIYRLTAKPQWEYTPAYASYVVLSVDPNLPAIIGSTGFTSGSTYAIDFTKNGVLSGLNCTTDQSIVYRDGAWVCSSPQIVEQLFLGSPEPEGGYITCPSPKKVTAGGCEFDNPGDCGFTRSAPLLDFSGWICSAIGAEGCAVVQGYAICQ
jgi:hypothetical protein